MPDHAGDGTCPTCGFAFNHAAETAGESYTPNDREFDYQIGADTNRTVRQEPAFPRALPPFPDIPNHTDFEVIGLGGMGTVYRAIQRPTDRAVAVKVINRYVADSLMRERFINEVRAHAKIAHPGIVPIFEVGHCSHGPYFTMEYRPGGTLAHRLQRGGLDDRESARIVADAAEAVHAAHREAIVHRDIKPSNILVDPEGRVKVTDFGLAKHAAGEDITQKGVIVGTFAYMSPEQASGDVGQITKLSDVYCLGSTLYQLVTREVAHHSKTTQLATVKAILGNPTPNPRKVRRDLCPKLDAIIQKSMAAVPAERYGSAELLARDLRRWLAGESPLAKPATRGLKVRRFLERNRLAVALVLLVPFLAAAAVVAGRERDPKHRIERALARGERVAIVDGTEIRTTPSWDWNGGKVTRDLLPDGSPGFETQDVALLRLVDDPMWDHYRIEAELRHCTRAGSTDSFVGLYFGPEDGAAADGTPFTRVHYVQYSDFPYPGEDRVPPAESPHRVRVQDFWRLRDGVSFDPFTLELFGSEPRALHFAPANDAANRNAWRKLALDVGPDGIRVSWTPDVRGPTQVSDWPASVLDMGIRNPNVRRITPGGASIKPLPWSPRRPIGIVGTAAGVAFRNVALTPLTGK